MKRKAIKIILVSLLLILSIAVLTVALIPDSAIKHLVQRSANKALNGKLYVSIEKFSLNPLTGVRMGKVVIEPTDGKTLDSALAVEGGVYDGVSCPPQVGNDSMVIDEMKIRPKLLSVLKKQPAANFSVKVGGGVIEGSVNKDAIEVKSKNISLFDVKLLSNMTSLPILGDMDARIDAKLENNKPVSMQAELDIANTALCPARVKLNKGGIPFLDVPYTRFGHIQGKVSMPEVDVIRFEGVSGDGPDLALSIDGDIMLKGEDRALTEFDLEITLRPGAEWMEKNSMDIIYKKCRRLPDDSVVIELSGDTSRPKIECGTPIEEVKVAREDNVKNEPETEESKKKIDDNPKNDDDPSDKPVAPTFDESVRNRPVAAPPVVAPQAPEPEAGLVGDRIDPERLNAIMKQQENLELILEKASERPEIDKRRMADTIIRRGVKSEDNFQKRKGYPDGKAIDDLLRKR